MNADGISLGETKETISTCRFSQLIFQQYTKRTWNENNPTREEIDSKNVIGRKKNAMLSGSAKHEHHAYNLDEIRDLFERKTSLVLELLFIGYVILSPF